MNMSFKQDARLGRLDTVLGPESLVLLRFFGADFMNNLFDYEVEALSSDPGVDFDALLGTHATVTVDTRSGPRHFDGIVTRARYAGAEENGYRFNLSLRPWFWLADQRFNQKIFHNKTVDKIVKEVLAPYEGAGKPALELKLEGDYPVLEYTVQYRESDFAFASRMMERFGISYHFEHEFGNHRMVLTDSDTSLKDIVGGSRKFKPVDGHHQPDAEHFWDLAPDRKIKTGAVRLIDYNFKTPRAEMLAERMGSAKHAFGALESYEYPGVYLDREEGRKIARIRNDQFQGDDRRTRAAGDCISLGSGMIVTVEAEGISNLGEPRQVCLASHHSFVSESYGSGGSESNGYSYSGSYVLMPASAPYAPPRQTPVPVVQGPQTAIVVGDGEIDCDEYGRVLVRFHWDLDGAISMRCRVSQQWAGAGLGQVVIPRIGMEVIVDFIDGDPDKPLVTGCVVNASNANIYGLPANKTRSGFKTKTHMGGGSNELMFEDAQGIEEIFLHAEKDMNRVIEDNESTQVNRGDRKVRIVAGDESKKLDAGNLTEDIALVRAVTATAIKETAKGGAGGAGNISYFAKDNFELTAEQFIRHNAHNNIEQDTKKSFSLRATDNIINDAGKVATHKAVERITLGVGKGETPDSVIEITPEQIVLRCGATQVTLTKEILDQMAGMIHLNKDATA
ncbi:type VI secretion system Vgr family protein [Paracoccus aminophilus]|uniref:Rhs accessory genetic element n=1 Tax=Paracoccus aminophilus JCM 7686 TaxID=1367847 RepID=S5Y2N8_PARAH|nr:type VI secretion system tip protein TssI/VgrG [Paracoccus aminophilus]AGT10005.1 rhs accessory genetic element [Paracoccus aminophilus JCM 7686]